MKTKERIAELVSLILDEAREIGSDVKALLDVAEGVEGRLRGVVGSGTMTTEEGEEFRAWSGASAESLREIDSGVGEGNPAETSLHVERAVPGPGLREVAQAVLVNAEVATPSSNLDVVGEWMEVHRSRLDALRDALASEPDWKKRCGEAQVDLLDMKARAETAEKQVLAGQAHITALLGRAIGAEQERDESFREAGICKARAAAVGTAQDEQIEELERERDEAEKECDRYDAASTRTRNVLRVAGIPELDYSEVACGRAMPLDERASLLVRERDAALAREKGLREEAQFIGITLDKENHWVVFPPHMQFVLNVDTIPHFAALLSTPAPEKGSDA